MPPFRRYLAVVDRVEQMLAGLCGRLVRGRGRARDTDGLEPFHEAAACGYRLFPIVQADLCFPVASALAHGRLEQAAQLAPSNAWHIARPLYG
jgi:hypothetical protein